MWIFKKRKTKLVSFCTGTDGMKAHEEFIENADNNGVKILHAYTTYHKYSSSHIPAYLNYVITIK